MTAKEFIETLKIISQDYSGEIPKREIFSLAKEYNEIHVFNIVYNLDENTWNGNTSIQLLLKDIN